MRLRFKANAIPEMKENPRIFFYPRDKRGKWSEVFGNTNPIYLEVGAGKGDFIIQSWFLYSNTCYNWSNT